jgi:photosystem II stability/assembly factor-like uncharacterized protein
MRLRKFLDTSSLLVATLLLSSTVSAKKDQPGVTATSFTHEPENVQYFEDSDVIVFQDYNTNNIIRSDNAGEKWDTIKDIPDGKAWTMYLHPFDTQRAYVLSRERTHWLTSDRGKTWTEWKTDYEFSRFRKPFAFHASDPNRIIFNAQDCQSVFCEELVSWPFNCLMQCGW